VLGALRLFGSLARLALELHASTLQDACVTPRAGRPPTGLTHPGLAIKDSIPLDGIPFAVAIAKSGLTYVTQTGIGSGARMELPDTAFSASFSVGDMPSQVRFSPDGRTAYFANQDARTISVVAVVSNQRTAVVPVTDGSILTIGLSPDGKTLYALTDYAGIHVIDTRTLTITGNIPRVESGTILTGVAFHPYSPCMYVAARDEGTVRTIDLTTNQVVAVTRVEGGRIQNVAVSLDGCTLFATDIERSKLLVRDIASLGSTFSEYEVGEGMPRNAFDVAVTPDNVHVYVSTLAEGRVYVFDRITRALVATIATGGSARYIGFTADGSRAVIPNEGGWVNVLHDTELPKP